jgi:cell division septum initiation protein DivIVA
MDEIDKIQVQIRGLLEARDHLLNQVPSDMVAIAEITERIIDLNRRLAALADAGATVRELTPGQVQALQQAVRALERAIQQSQAASEILMAATQLANAAA